MPSIITLLASRSSAYASNLTIYPLYRQPIRYPQIFNGNTLLHTYSIVVTGGGGICDGLKPVNADPQPNNTFGVFIKQCINGCPLGFILSDLSDCILGQIDGN